MLADRDRFETPGAVPRHHHLDFADLGRDGLRIGAVAGVPRPSTLDRVTFVAEMVGHLDFQAPLQHVAHQVGQQPAVTGESDALGAGTVNQLGSPVINGGQRCAVSRRHRQTRRRPLICRRLLRHERNPFEPTAISCRPSDHATYTNFRTVPIVVDLAYFMWTGEIPIGLGAGAIGILTKDGALYVGPQVGIGQSEFSGAVRAGWMFQLDPPTKAELDSYASNVGDL